MRSAPKSFVYFSMSRKSQNLAEKYSQDPNGRLEFQEEGGLPRIERLSSSVLSQRGSKKPWSSKIWPRKGKSESQIANLRASSSAAGHYYSGAVGGNIRPHRHLVTNSTSRAGSRFSRQMSPRQFGKSRSFVRLALLAVPVLLLTFGIFGREMFSSESIAARSPQVPAANALGHSGLDNPLGVESSKQAAEADGGQVKRERENSGLVNPEAFAGMASLESVGEPVVSDDSLKRAEESEDFVIPKQELPEARSRMRGTGYFDHIVSQGETFSKLFSDYGIQPQTATEVDRVLRLSADVDHRLKPGQVITLYQGDSSEELSKLEIKLDITRTAKLSKSSDGWELEIDKLPSETQGIMVGGTIKSSFSEAASEAGLSHDAVDDFVDMFSARVRFHRDIKTGDRFAVLYERDVLEDGTIVGFNGIKAAALKRDGKISKAIKVTNDKGKEFFVDENGDAVGSSFLRYPLKFSRISSSFNRSRLHPVLKRRMPHLGVDFAAPTGTPVRSVSDGRITFAGRKGPNGIMIKITHDNRYKTAYLHLSKISKGLKAGSYVKRGQIIGAVGSTGRSTGPHLDYRLYDRNKSVDPLRAKLPKIDLGAEILTAKGDIKDMSDLLTRLIEESGDKPEQFEWKKS